MRYRITIELVQGYKDTREEVILDCKNDAEAQRRADEAVEVVNALARLAAVVSVKLENSDV